MWKTTLGPVQVQFKLKTIKVQKRKDTRRQRYMRGKYP